jgi:hypothetical protein
MLNSIKLEFVPWSRAFFEKVTHAQRVKDNMKVFVEGSGSVFIDPHSIPFRFLGVIFQPR